MSIAITSPCLLERARSNDPADLFKDARRDLAFQELYGQPERYRGTRVEVQGLAQRLYSSTFNNGTTTRLFEVWVTVPDGGPNPFACIVENLPPGFPLTPVIAEPVVFRGCFLRDGKWTLEGDIRARQGFVKEVSLLAERTRFGGTKDQFAAAIGNAQR